MTDNDLYHEGKRLRVNGSAQLSIDDPLRSEFPGSVFIVRVTANTIPFYF